jgi:hypothetical protein
MVTLSTKARLFLEAALAGPGTAWLRNEVMSLGPDPWSRALSSHAVRVAIDALSATEKHIRDRLGDPKLDMDEQADLINDLGFVDAVQSDLQRDLRGAGP